MVKKELKKILPILFLLVLTLVFFYPLLSGYIFSAKGFTQSDLLNLNLPFRYFYGEWLRRGIFPFWTPLIHLGYPLFAESETGMLYPIRIMFHRLLPPILAFNLDIILHVFLAGSFTYLFARRVAKLSKLSAIFSAVTFMFGGAVLVHIMQTNALDVIAWLPLELLVIEQLLKRVRFSTFLGLVFVLTMGLLAGYIEVYFYFQLAFGLYLGIKVFFKNQKNLGKALLPLFTFALASLCALALSLPQVSSTLELLGQTNRSSGYEESQNNNNFAGEKYLESFIFPGHFSFFTLIDTAHDYNVIHIYSYLGIIPLALLFVGVWLAVKNKGYGQTLLILAICLSVVSFDRIFPLYDILFKTIPFMRLFRSPRFFVLTSLILAVLSGYGLETLMSRLRKFKWVNIFSAVIILLVFADLYLNNFPKLKAVPEDEWLKLPQSGRMMQPSLSHYRIDGYNPISVKATDDLSVHYALREGLPMDFNMVWNLPIAVSNVALALDRFSYFGAGNPNMRYSLIQGDRISPKEELVKMLSLQGIKYLIKDKQIADPRLKLVGEIPLGTTIAAQQLVGQTTQEAVLQQSEIKKFYLYENTQVLPRAFVVPQTTVVKTEDENELFNRLADPKLDLAKTVLLEEDPPGPGTSKKVKATVEFNGYEPNWVRLKATTDNPGWLVLTDTYYPGWKAFVDGIQTKIYRGDFDFRTLPLPKGLHEVVFTFEPTYWRVSWYVSGATVGLLIMFTLILKLRGVKK